MPTPPADIIVLSGAGCSGKTTLAWTLKHKHGFAQVSVWGLRQMHLVEPMRDRDLADDYVPGVLIAEAACLIYASRARRSVIEDIGDAEAISAVKRFQRHGHNAVLVTLVADDGLIRERLNERNALDEFNWIKGLNDQIRRRALVSFERRFEARDWINRYDELTTLIAL